MVKLINFLVQTLLLVSSAYSQSYFGNSMEECERFAAEFKNTCDTSEGTPANVASIPGEIVSCRNTGDYCVDSGNLDADSGVCEWTRKLCVTCSYYGTSRILINV